MSYIEESEVKNYFTVSKKVIDRLLDVDISAEQILAYLVLACFTYNVSTETTKIVRKVKIRRRNPLHKNIHPISSQREIKKRIWEAFRQRFRKKFLKKNKNNYTWQQYRRELKKEYLKAPKARSIEHFIPYEEVPRSNLFKLTGASANAVEKYTGIRRDKAKEIIASLGSLCTEDGTWLLRSVREWNKTTENNFKPADEDKPYLQKSGLIIKNEVVRYGEAARYVLNNFDEYPSDQVKLPNELITGAKTKSVREVLKAPLKTLYRLRQHKDEAVRLLLSAYLHRDPREKIVDPYNSFAFDYDLDKVDDSGSATLWKTSNYCSRAL